VKKRRWKPSDVRQVCGAPKSGSNTVTFGRAFEKAGTKTPSAQVVGIEPRSPEYVG
jgi:hypothetical protein